MLLSDTKEKSAHLKLSSWVKEKLFGIGTIKSFLNFYSKSVIYLLRGGYGKYDNLKCYGHQKSAFIGRESGLEGLIGKKIYISFNISAHK